MRRKYPISSAFCPFMSNGLKFDYSPCKRHAFKRNNNKKEKPAFSNHVYLDNDYGGEQTPWKDFHFSKMIWRCEIAPVQSGSILALKLCLPATNMSKICSSRKNCSIFTICLKTWCLSGPNFELEIWANRMTWIDSIGPIQINEQDANFREVNWSS